MLWKALSNNKLDGKKFRRQHSIGKYIVDFYCPSERIIVELDGQPHFNPISQVYDFERDEWLRSLNFRVLRFENWRVRQNVGLVLETIRKAIYE